MSYLLDTDIVSAHLKSNRLVSNRVVQYLGRIHVSVITIGELRTWTMRKQVSRKRDADLEYFLRDVTVVDVTEEIGRKFGELRAGLLDQGLDAPTMDLWIAATAIIHGLILVTHNLQDF
jgi:tRNA(fMet)-specific endonuclease VapC